MIVSGIFETNRQHSVPVDPAAKHATSVPTILLADDHVELLQTVAQMLEGKFKVVGTAEDGRSALELVHNVYPDLLIVDVAMPIMDGIEAALHLREENSLTKVLFLTVYDDGDFLEAAMSTGALGYVLKQRLATDLIPGVWKVLKGDTFVSASANLQ